MVLADTSCWIKSLANKEPFKAEMDKLLAVDEVASHEMVYGELLIGDRGARQHFLQSYVRIYQASTVPHAEVIDFVRKRNLNGRGVGWIDIHLLASAIVGRLQLWTVDSALLALANEFGVAYQGLDQASRTFSQ